MEILKWRYVSTRFWATFCGHIPLHRPYIGLVGTSNLGCYIWKHYQRVVWIFETYDIPNYDLRSCQFWNDFLCKP
jgi:hypothetical protein